MRLNLRKVSAEFVLGPFYVETVLPPLANNSTKLRRSDRNKGKIVHYFPEVQHETSTFENKNITNSAVKQHELNNNHRID